MLPINIDLTEKSILVTSVAGFIGSNLVKLLLHDYPSARIVGIDSVNDYYDVSLKEYRLRGIETLAKSVQSSSKQPILTYCKKQ